MLSGRKGRKKRQCRKLENGIVAQGKGTESLGCREKVEKLRIGISGRGSRHLNSQYSKMEAKGPRVQDLSLLCNKNCPPNGKQQRNLQKRKKRNERKEKELIAAGGTGLFCGGGRTEGGADLE